MSNNKIESGFLSVHNEKGLSAVFSSFGAGVCSLRLDGEPLILEVKDKNQYLTSEQYFGKTLGRVAGRITSKHTIGGKVFNLKKVEGNLCLHGGGNESFSYKDFSCMMKNSQTKKIAVFSYVSKEGECGFPGELHVSVTYAIPLDSNELEITYEATSTEETIVSLSNHIYWHLPGDEDVSSYNLFVSSSKVAANGKQTKLLKTTVPVSDALDFRDISPLGEKLDKIEKQYPLTGFDHCYLLEKNADGPEISFENSRYRIECHTDYAGANIYVDSTCSDVPFLNADCHKKRRAIAIEPQMYPLHDLVLLPGATYRHTIRYNFIKK